MVRISRAFVQYHRAVRTSATVRLEDRVVINADTGTVVADVIAERAAHCHLFPATWTRPHTRIGCCGLAGFVGIAGLVGFCSSLLG